MHSEQELVALRDRIHRLEAMVTAAYAVITRGEPDYRARCDAAADRLRELFALPTARPGAWEAAHVTALEGELRGILDGLTGGAS